MRVCEQHARNAGSLAEHSDRGCVDIARSVRTQAKEGRLTLTPQAEQPAPKLSDRGWLLAVVGW